MKITVYADFNNEEVITEKEYLKRLNEAVAEMAEDTALFYEWLEDTYSASEIWRATPEKHEEIIKEWKDHCQGYTENDGELMWWKKYGLEV